MLKEEGENFLSFVFVRHPLDRLESAYYDKIVIKPGTELGQYWSQLLMEIRRKCKYRYNFFVGSFEIKNVGIISDGSGYPKLGIWFL